MNEREQGPGLAERLGAAIVAPRRALAAVDRPAGAGRTSGDAVVLILVAAVVSSGATLIAAALIGDGRAAIQLLVGALAGRTAGPLAFLFAAALVLYGVAGPPRSFGRAVDLASVAVVPLVAVRLLGELALRAATGAVGGAGAPGWAPLIVQAVAYAAAAAYLVPAAAAARRPERA